jgi:hypothetical protein
VICTVAGEWGMLTLQPHGLLIHQNCLRNVETLKLKWIITENQNPDHEASRT